MNRNYELFASAAIQKLPPAPGSNYVRHRTFPEHDYFAVKYEGAEWVEIGRVEYAALWVAQKEAGGLHSGSVVTPREAADHHLKMASSSGSP